MFLTTALLKHQTQNFIIVRYYSKLPKLKRRGLIVPAIKPIGIRIYSKTTLSKGWQSKKIVPDIIDDVPSRRLTVEYPTVSISEGNIVKPKQTVDPPKVMWKAKEPKSYFSLCLTNPDAPKKEWLHWLVVNIPENQLEKGEKVINNITYTVCRTYSFNSNRLLYIDLRKSPKLFQPFRSSSGEC